jgi:hypothetical protein
MIWHGINAGEERWGRELVWVAGDGAVIVRGRRGQGISSELGGRRWGGLGRGDKSAVFFQN